MKSSMNFGDLVTWVRLRLCHDLSRKRTQPWTTALRVEPKSERDIEELREVGHFIDRENPH